MGDTQGATPDMLISILPLVIPYAFASYFMLRKRDGELTRSNGFRRWGWMNLVVIGLLVLSFVQAWPQQMNAR